MIHLSGMRSNVATDGEGPCAVFVHGQGGDLRSWNRLWPYLIGSQRLVRYDLRNYGGSCSTSEHEFTHSQDLAELIEALTVERCDLVGVSMGGGIALSFALDHPERVRSLTLISPQIAGWEWSEDWQTRWQPIIDAARCGKMEQAKQLWWEHPMFATTRTSEAARDLQEEIKRFTGLAWQIDRHALVMPDIERVHKLQVPTLLLSGREDMEDFQLMADIITGSSELVQQVYVPEAGHLAHLEKPQFCADHITDFWRRTSAPL